MMHQLLRISRLLEWFWQGQGDPLYTLMVCKLPEIQKKAAFFLESDNEDQWLLLQIQLIRD